MSIDEILKSTGESRAEMAGNVRQYREMAAASEMVLADHWDIEDLICSVEDLATRLQNIRNLVAGYPDDGTAISQLAHAIEEAALPTTPPATEILRARLGLTDPTPEGNKLLLSDRPVYGHPGLRVATHAELSVSHRALLRSTYIVSPATGTIAPLRENETADDAIERLGLEFLNAN